MKKKKFNSIFELIRSNPKKYETLTRHIEDSEKYLHEDTLWRFRNLVESKNSIRQVERLIVSAMMGEDYYSSAVTKVLLRLKRSLAATKSTLIDAYCNQTLFIVYARIYETSKRHPNW